MSPHVPIQPDATPDQVDIISTIAHHEPDFFRYIDQAQKTDRTARLCLGENKSEHGWHISTHQKEVLCACLEYALERGVAVTVTCQTIVARSSDDVNKVWSPTGESE